MPEVIDFSIVGRDDFTQSRGRFPVEGRRQDGAQDPRLCAMVREGDAQSWAASR